LCLILSFRIPVSTVFSKSYFSQSPFHNHFLQQAFIFISRTTQLHRHYILIFIQNYYMFRLFQQSSSRILVRGEWPLVTNSGCKVIVKFLMIIPKVCFSDIILIFCLSCLLVLRVIVHLLSWFVVFQLTLICAWLPTYRVQITHCSRAGEWTEAIEQYSHAKPHWHASVTSSTRALAGRLRLKCDGTRAETRFRLSTKQTSPFKSAGASVQPTTGRRAVHISLRGLYCSCKPVFCSHVTLHGTSTLQ
jgi:hypothetical protein